MQLLLLLNRRLLPTKKHYTFGTLKLKMLAKLPRQNKNKVSKLHVLQCVTCYKYNIYTYTAMCEMLVTYTASTLCQMLAILQCVKINASYIYWTVWNVSHILQCVKC